MDESFKEVHPFLPSAPYTKKQGFFMDMESDYGD